MKNMPFYIPELDLNLRVAKMLILLATLSKIGKPNIGFSLEKVALLDYLSKHPKLLNKLLSDKDKNIISLENFEVYSIEALFPNRGQIFNFGKVKALLNIMFVYDFLEVKLEANYQPSYILKETGFELASTLDSQYFLRLVDIVSKMKPLLSLSNSQFFSLIDSHSYGSKT